MERLRRARNRVLGWFRKFGGRLRHDGARWLVMLLGLVMIGIGSLVPGTHSQAIAVLIVIGAGLFVVGALLPWFKEAEVGVKSFRIIRGEKAEATPWLKTEETALGRVAELVLPDQNIARQVVEETVEAIQTFDDPISPEERATTIFRTLVSCLERANEEIWIDGNFPVLSPSTGIEALRLVDFPARIAYVLRNQGLQEQEVAKILRRRPEEIESARQEVRATIKPFVEGRRKAADA
jgi:hypothetical protein